jgi:FkbM family methyltransferase
MTKILIKIINRILKTILLRIQPITRFQLITEALIRQGRQIKFVQIGANDGIQFDDLYITVTSQRWKGLVVEPLKDLHERLALNYQDYPQVIPVNVAIHPTIDRAAVYRVNRQALQKYPAWAAGIASMHKSHLLRNKILDDDIVAEYVKCQPLMPLLHQFHCLDADVLQIDTEGFDAEIIKMIDFSEFRPLVIKFEWINLAIADKESVVGLLTNAEYRCEVERGESDCVAWVSKSISI